MLCAVGSSRNSAGNANRRIAPIQTNVLLRPINVLKCPAAIDAINTATLQIISIAAAAPFGAWLTTLRNVGR